MFYMNHFSLCGAYLVTPVWCLPGYTCCIHLCGTYLVTNVDIPLYGTYLVTTVDIHLCGTYLVTPVTFTWQSPVWNLPGYKCRHSPVWYLPGATCVVITWLHMSTFTYVVLTRLNLCGAYLFTPVWCLPVYTCRHSPVWYVPGYTCGGLCLVDPCFVHLHRVSVYPQILVLDHLNYKGVQHFSQGILSSLVSKKIIEQKI